MGSHKVVQKPAILVMAIDCRTSNAPETGPQAFLSCGESFMAKTFQVEFQTRLSMKSSPYTVTMRATPLQPYSVVIGCPVSSIDTIPEGMVAKNHPSKFLRRRAVESILEV